MRNVLFQCEPDISRPLEIFLDYVDGHAPADEFTKGIDSEVAIAKNRDEWRREYMTLALEMEKEKKLSWEAGKAEGKIEMAIDLFRRGVITEEMAALAAGISVDELRKSMIVS